MRAFRDLYYRNAGISTVEGDVARDTLLVMEKRTGSHMATFGNITEMVSFLKEEFPSYRVVRATWSDYTMFEQVEMMSRTRAMISLPGSDIMNGIFVQDKTPIVLYPRMCSKNDDYNQPELKYWYNRVEYVEAELEDCDSPNVTTVDAGDAVFTYVKLDSLKDRLNRLGIH